MLTVVVRECRGLFVGWTFDGCFVAGTNLTRMGRVAALSLESRVVVGAGGCGAGCGNVLLTLSSRVVCRGGGGVGERW